MDEQRKAAMPDLMVDGKSHVDYLRLPQGIMVTGGMDLKKEEIS
jgi:hypothetical protein